MRTKEAGRRTRSLSSHSKTVEGETASGEMNTEHKTQGQLSV